MKTTYRQATEMRGYSGAVIRGDIYGKILREFYSQPDVKAGTVKAILLGIVYGLTVVVLGLVLYLGVFEILFYVVGLFVAAYLAAFAAPTKKFFVFLSERMDKEFEL